MRTRTRTAFGATLAAATLLAAAAPAMTAPRSTDAGLRAVGLTADDKLVTFSTGNARGASVISKVSGLQGADTDVVGIDYRVQDSKLYGVGNGGGVYRINATTGAATLVTQLTVALDGTSFGVDFNPAANALRVISNTGQNLRQPFATYTGTSFAATTAVDGALTYPATPTTPAVVATGVTAAAYTNNDLDVNTGTSLFDIDTALDQVVLQSPANAGLLSATGKLLQDAGSDAGFDIYSTIRDGRAVAVDGYATLSVGGSQRLYAINLLSGEATLKGTFASGTQLQDLAIRLNQR